MLVEDAKHDPDLKIGQHFYLNGIRTTGSFCFAAGVSKVRVIGRTTVATFPNVKKDPGRNAC